MSPSRVLDELRKIHRLYWCAAEDIKQNPSGRTNALASHTRKLDALDYAIKCIQMVHREELTALEGTDALPIGDQRVETNAPEL